MGISAQWYALAVVTSLLNGSTLGFIAWRERNLALRQWALAWLAWGLAAIPLALLGGPEARPLVAIVCGLLWVASSLFFLRGAFALAVRPMPRTWYVVACAAAALALGLGVGPEGAAGMVPLVLFQSTGLMGTGVLLIRNAGRRAGAWLCGVALIGLGAHLLDAPLLAGHPRIFLWGFVVAICLQVLTALGMLMFYYEQAHARVVETERELAQTRRIEALGRIAGGVAHDFNNMLTVMQAHTELMRHPMPEGPSQAESLAAIQDAIDRAGRLTAQLLAFGRRSVVQPQTVDVRGIVSRTLDLLKQVVPETIQLRFVSDEASYVGAMDQALLEQIVLNLVTNARDAISGQGSILVELRCPVSPEPRLLLRVTDDGVGMDEGTAARVFEPFYSLKPPGRGTGLGLPSVQGAVSQLGGHVRVTSVLGTGTTFEVELPWVSAKETTQLEVESGPHPSLRILVVDDDAGVRDSTAKILLAGGHAADQAADGIDALEMVQATDYDVVISDVLMPRMGGIELLEAVSKIRPALSFVLTSGYPRDARFDTAKVDFLPKPFKRGELLKLVASLGKGPKSASRNSSPRQPAGEVRTIETARNR